MRVLITGTTGLVGKELLAQLLEDNRIDDVHSIARRSTEVKNPKLTEHIMDLQEIKQKGPGGSFEGVYCCLGTTIKKAGSKDNFRMVDYEFVVSLAEKYNSSKRFLVVSAMGADPGAKIFYNKTKGEMEEAVKKSGFQNVQIFRPSLLLGDRNEFRFGEKVGSIFMRFFSPLMIGSLKKYRPIKAEAVGNALINATFKNAASVEVYDSHQIQKLSEEN